MTSAIERELIKAGNVGKQKTNEKRAEYLRRLLDTINGAEGGLDDKAFNKLSKEAQQWANLAAKAVDKGRPIVDFPPEDDDDEPAPPKKKAAAPVEDDDDDEPAPKKKNPPVEDDDDEPAPRKKARAVADDDDDEPAPPKKKKPAVADDDDDEPAPKKKSRAVVEDDDDDEPAPRKRAAVADDDDDDGEQEDDEMAKKRTTAKKKVAKTAAKKKVAKPTRRASGNGKGAINTMKAMLIKKPSLTNAQIIERLEAKGIQVSKNTISMERGSFLASWRKLYEAGIAKTGPDID